MSAEKIGTTNICRKKRQLINPLTTSVSHHIETNQLNPKNRDSYTPTKWEQIMSVDKLRKIISAQKMGTVNVCRKKGTNTFRENGDN